MRYSYDNSLDGLFTVIFEQYKHIEDSIIAVKSDQLDFLNDNIYVETNTDKSSRVKKSIIDNFGFNFYRSINYAFVSENPDKSTIIAKTIKNMYTYGYNFINSSDKIAVAFNSLCKYSTRELHAYKGLLRFKEIQDNFLFAEFEPNNDILELLTYHFKNRLRNEKFVIYDKKRNKCAIYVDNDLAFYDVQEIFKEESDEEKMFEDCWIEFYNSVGIKERQNLKLMQNNMPKRYWKYLPEKNKIYDNEE